MCRSRTEYAISAIYPPAMSKATQDAHRDTRRRFEQWAKNPLCQANVLSAVHNVAMADVAQREGGKPTMGQSPFAIARGQTFERSLFRNGAEVLLAALKKAGVLPEAASGLEDFRLRMNGGKCKSLDEALERTAALFADSPPGRQAFSRRLSRARPCGIPGGIMLPEAMLVLDALSSATTHAATHVDGGRDQDLPRSRRPYGPDGAGNGPRASGGVRARTRPRPRRARLGVRLQSRTRGVPGPEQAGVQSSRRFALAKTCAIRPSGPSEGSSGCGCRRATPSDRGARSFRRYRCRSNRYCEACVSFCDRADVCRSRALASGDPAVLGDDVARFLGAVSLPRTIELMNGATPATPAESDLSRRVRELEALRSLS